MKMKLAKYTHGIASVILLTLILTSVSSCEYFIKSEEAETIKEAKSNEIVSIQKDEAKLLVLASKRNLDVIELCKIIEDEEVSVKVKKLVEQIKKDQLKILNEYMKLASENVISIPRHSDLKYEEILKLNSKDLEAHINLLNTKIYTQQELLEKLSDTTNNSEFKALAQQANTTLRESLNKTEQTLKILHTDS